MTQHLQVPTTTRVGVRIRIAPPGGGDHFESGLLPQPKEEAELAHWRAALVEIALCREEVLKQMAADGERLGESRGGAREVRRRLDGHTW